MKPTNINAQQKKNNDTRKAKKEGRSMRMPELLKPRYFASGSEGLQVYDR